MSYANVYKGGEVSFGLTTAGRVMADGDTDRFYLDAAKHTPPPTGLTEQLVEFRAPQWSLTTHDYSPRGGTRGIPMRYEKAFAGYDLLGFHAEFDAHTYEEGFWAAAEFTLDTGGINPITGIPIENEAKIMLHVIRGRIVDPTSEMTLTQGEFAPYSIMVEVRAHKWGVSIGSVGGDGALDAESKSDGLYLIGRNMDTLRGDYRRGGVALLQDLLKIGAGDFGRDPSMASDAATGMTYQTVGTAAPTLNMSAPQNIIPRYRVAPSG